MTALHDSSAHLTPSDEPVPESLDAPITGMDSIRYQALRSIERRRNFRTHVFVAAIGISALTAIWAVTEYQNSGGWPASLNDSPAPGVWNSWIVYPVVIWLSALAGHAVATFVRRPTTRRELDEEIARIGGRGSERETADE